MKESLRLRGHTDQGAREGFKGWSQPPHCLLLFSFWSTGMGLLEVACAQPAQLDAIKNRAVLKVC